MDQNKTSLEGVVPSRGKRGPVRVECGDRVTHVVTGGEGSTHYNIVASLRVRAGTLGEQPVELDKDEKRRSEPNIAAIEAMKH